MLFTTYWSSNLSVGEILIQRFDEFISSPEIINGLITSFTLAFFIFLLLISYAIRWWCSYYSSHASTAPLTRALRAYGAGFLVFLVFIITTNIIIDPFNLYGTGLFEPYKPDTRTYKPQNYLDLSYEPDVVVLGSSRSWPLDSAMIREHTGYSMYNAGLSGGTVNDVLIFTRFMAEQSHRFPPVLFVEVIAEDVGRVSAEWSPIMYPHMSLKDIFQSLSFRTQSTLNLDMFSTSLFLIFKDYEAVEQSSDGSRQFDLVSSAELEEDIDFAIGENKTKNWDVEFSAFRSAVEELITIAHEQNSVIIFYYTPVHPRYWEEALWSNSTFRNLHTNRTNFLLDMDQQHKSVFFLDFSQTSSIGGLEGEEGYSDFSHMTPRNANLLIKAAADTIRQSYLLAEQKRANHSG